jgi:hypothetical protein
MKVPIRLEWRLSAKTVKRRERIRVETEISGQQIGPIVQDPVIHDIRATSGARLRIHCVAVESDRRNPAGFSFSS